MRLKFHHKSTTRSYGQSAIVGIFWLADGRPAKRAKKHQHLRTLTWDRRIQLHHFRSIAKGLPSVIHSNITILLLTLSIVSDVWRKLPAIYSLAYY